MKRTYVLLALLALTTTFCNAQTELPASVEKGRIMTADGEKIIFAHLQTGVEQHNYKIRPGARAQTIPADNVLRIDQQTGTEAGKWALYMGASGLLVSAIGVANAKIEAKRHNYGTNDAKLIPLALGLTAVFALVGVAIGASKKKYKTVYNNPKYGNTPASNAPLRIGLAAPAPQGIGIGLYYRLGDIRR